MSNRKPLAELARALSEDRRQAIEARKARLLEEMTAQASS